jgi:hypothetical protein
MRLNASNMGSGVTMAAMGAMLFFAFTTVLAGVWGGIQFQALQSSRTELAALEQRLVSMKAGIEQPRALPKESAPMPEPEAPPHQQTAIASTETHESVDSIPPDDPYHDMQTLSAAVNNTENLEGEAAEALIQTCIEETFSIQYGDFLNACKLTAEERAQIEQWLREDMASNMRMGMKATQNRRNDPASAIHKLYSETSTRRRVLNAKLEKVLSPEEMEAWQENERAFPDRIQAHFYDRLLEDHARSMSKEGRAAAIGIIVRETSSARGYIQGTLTHQSDVTAGMMEGLSVQIQGVVNAREKLAEILSPADYRAYDRFVEEIRRRNEMMGRVVVSPDASLALDSLQ